MKDNDFIRDCLVDKVGKKSCGGVAYNLISHYLRHREVLGKKYLVITLKRPPELTYEPYHDQLANLR